MKKTDWIDVIGKIDPAYVKEAEQWSKAAQKKKKSQAFHRNGSVRVYSAGWSSGII